MHLRGGMRRARPPVRRKSRDTKRARAIVRRPQRRGFANTRAAAQRRLKRFRRGSLVAVAATGLFLMLLGTEDVPAQESDTVAVVVPSDSAAAADSAAADTMPVSTAQSVEEATGTLRRLRNQFTGVLPKVLIALGLVVFGALLVKLVRAVLRRALRRWEKAEAVSAMMTVLIWLLAIGVGLSVITGDARALVGSVGLLGLAISWALQAPIESFAGWILNSFKVYYRVGDRIAVGEVFGDVYRIDSLTTTVWEAGGPDKPVQGAQPTGALITFPNSEVLRANIVNYTRGFPFVWDEVTITVANESDLTYAISVASRVSNEIIGPEMVERVRAYRRLLERRRLAFDVSEKPQVYVSPDEAWTNVTVRYLVPARERRKWSSRLYEVLSTEFNKSEHASRITTGYPVRRVLMEDGETS